MKRTKKTSATGIVEAKKIWMDGEMVDWKDAKTHILSHVIHYGSSVFEGARCYDAKQGPACFRLHDHMERLLLSAKIYRMDVPYNVTELVEAAKELIRQNDLRSCYIRPIVYRGYGQLGVNPLGSPVRTAIAAWRWDSLFDDPSVQKEGIDTCVSSWVRMAPNTLPLLAKAGANYLNSQLIKMEALQSGYHEGIALDVNGYVSEGSAENVFIVKHGGVITPPSAASILPGITRHVVLTIAKELGYEVRKQMIPREGLYIADEIFFTGTACEVTPVRSVDGLKVGAGKPGPVTRALQDRFRKVVTGEVDDTHGWLDYV